MKTAICRSGFLTRHPALAARCRVTIPDLRQLILIVLMLVVPTLLAACSATGKDAPTPTPLPTPVVASKPTFITQRGTVVDDIAFTGRFAAAQQDFPYFGMDGRVGKINVHTGDNVKKGAILAELEISDLLNQRAQAQLTLQQAQSKLKSAQDNATEQNTQLDIALQTARLRLDQTKVRDPAPSITIAVDNRDKAGAAVEAAQAAYDKRGQVSGSPEALNLQRATWDYDIARATYELALQGQKTWQYDVSIQEQAVLLAESNLRKAQLSVDPVLSQDVDKAKLAVDRLQAQIDNSRLTSSVDGQVTMIAILVGQTTQAYKQAMTVAMPGPLDVSASLQKDNLEKLSIGLKATLTFPTYPGREFMGTIRRLPYPYGGSGSPNDTDQSTRISIDDPAVSLEPGVLATVHVILRQHDNALWLPPAAIRTFQGRSFVVVQDGDAQRRVAIETGISSNERVEITDGLSDGQIIIGP
jgi:multidrug efflux pump subunit AcrA (membrane-fusion protein)